MQESLRLLYTKDIVNLSDYEMGYPRLLDCCSLCWNSNCCDTQQTTPQHSYIATGITSSDIISELSNSGIRNVKNWHTGAVMFLAIEPTRKLGTSTATTASGATFIPFQSAVQNGISPNTWSHFTYTSVEEIFVAAVQLFQLKNACLSYVRKCHFPDIAPASDYVSLRNTSSKATTELCSTTFLLKELQLLQPTVVFCVEMDAQFALFQLLAKEGLDISFEIMKLPKPSYTRLMGLRQNAFKHALFGLMAEGLVKAKVIDESFATDCFKKMIM